MKNFLLIVICLSYWCCNKEPYNCNESPDRCHIYSPKTCEEIAAENTPILADLAQHLHPITGSDPKNSELELTALGEGLRDAEFVGLGEATHGTLEFFEMKDRIFRFLVNEYNFKVMGFEATWGGALYVNQYVLHGIGDPKEAIKKMQFWTWDTEEVLSMVNWMRQYNMDKEENEKIHFYGFDMQSGIEEIHWIKEYLKQHQPILVDEIIPLLKTFVDRANFNSYENLSTEVRAEHLANIINARIIFNESKAELVAASSAKEFELHEYAFEILEQFHDILIRNSGFSRDYYMAKNSQWIQDYMGNNEKIALWAHNGHVTRSGAYQSQGAYLDEWIGDNYKNIGFSFAQGTFQAVNDVFGLTTRNSIFKLECSSGNALLKDLDSDNFYLVLNEIPEDSESHSYFNSLQPFLSIGSVFNGEPKNYYLHQNMIDAFDILIHFSSTQAAVPL